jgi:hypothetical protein
MTIVRSVVLLVCEDAWQLYWTSGVLFRGHLGSLSRWPEWFSFCCSCAMLVVLVSQCCALAVSKWSNPPKVVELLAKEDVVHNAGLASVRTSVQEQ